MATKIPVPKPKVSVPKLPKPPKVAGKLPTVPKAPQLGGGLQGYASSKMRGMF